MRRFLALGAGVLSLVIIGTAFLGCGGGGATGVVASITLAPAAVSLTRGATAQLTVQALDANNNVVATPTLSFSSDKPEIITVSSSGLICAGQWDANFLVCRTADNNHNPLPLGPASISATATVNGKTITSSTVVVTDHERIDRVVVVPDPGNPAGCVSQNPVNEPNTALFKVQAFSNDPAVCPSPPCQLPDSTIGSINWFVSPAQVATADAATHTSADPVKVTAAAPGAGVVVGSVGTVGSAVSGSAPFTTCAVASIHVRQQNPPTPPDTETSFTAPVGATVPLVADVTDTKNFTLTDTLAASALTWMTSQPALATVSLGTVVTAAPGTAQITAACLPPGCNVNLNQAIYSDGVVTANITANPNGNPPSSTVLVTTATAPANSTSSNNIIPIDTTTNNPGTAFTLPANVQVNSMVLTPLGSPAFLGTNCGTGTSGPSGAACSGLLRFDPTVTTVGTPLPTIPGTVLATDATHVVVSNPATNQIFIATTAPAIEATPAISIASSIVAAPTGATESGNTVTITTTTPHGLTTGQSVLVAGVAVAGYNGVYTVTPSSPTTFTYTDPNAGLAASGGGYVTGGAAAAIPPDGSKIYIVAGGKLYIYRAGLPEDLSGKISPSSSQAVAFFATGTMAYVADSAGDDVVTTCNDTILKNPPVTPVPVSGFPTHIAAVPNGTAMVDASSPNIDEVDASSDGACPPAITNTVTNTAFPNVSDFAAKQLIVTPDSKLAIILGDTCTTGTMSACTDTSHQGVLVYDLGTKQTSVVPLGGARPLSSGVTPDSANLYVGATDGKVHRIDLKTLTDAQNPPLTVSLCPSVSAGCNPDFVVVRPVTTVATLSSIAVTPANPTISVTDPAQSCPAGALAGEVCFKATGTYSDKTTRDITAFVVWSSSNKQVAIIGPDNTVTPALAPGEARALASGSAIISATSAGVSNSTTLTVK